MDDSPDAGFATNLPRQEMTDLVRLSKQFGTSISDAFSRGVAGGRSLSDTLQSLGQRLSQLALRSAFKPLESALTTGIESLVKAAIGATGAGATIPSANGNVVAGGRIAPFAGGGIVSAPAYFPLGRDTGLMGEAGPEAIMPLSRGADGRLGVRAGGAGARPVAVTVNVTTPDADSFRRSEAQVAAALARAVARGHRAL